MAKTFKRLTDTLTSTDIRWLAHAIREASAWKGGVVDLSNDKDVAEFDAKIKRMKEALKAAKLTKLLYDESLD